MDRLKQIFERFYNQNPFFGNLIFVDVETTGFASNARVIEIGAIATIFDGFDLRFSTYETLVNPGELIVPKITEITGITNDELKTAPGDEVYSDFVKWIQKINPKNFVAHNAQFDEARIKYNLQRVGHDITIQPFLCTVKMSRKFNKLVKNDQLKTLAEHYRFDNKQAHRALADAEVCAYIFAKLYMGEER